MNIKTYSKVKDGDTNLSDNFKVKEFACNDGSDKILIDLDMIPVLQKIRELGGTLYINSAYRTETYNKRVGGATKSYHLYGRAFDIKSQKLSISDVCNVANSLGVKGIIKYSSFVHVDTRPSKYHASSDGLYIAYGKFNIPFANTIKNGSKGNDVGVVQFKLNSLGYECGNADCVCGNKTVKAIKEFQKKNNLSVDGICGVNTWNKLFN